MTPRPEQKLDNKLQLDDYDDDHYDDDHYDDDHYDDNEPPSVVSSSSVSSSSSTELPSISLLPSKKNDTISCHTPKDGAPFVICNSKNDFINPTSTLKADHHPKQKKKMTVKEWNEATLNLDLGQSRFLERSKVKWILFLIQCLDRVTMAQWLWEPFLFWIWSKLIPLGLRRKFTFALWSLYSKFHRRVFGKRTGLHPSQSWEYHALTTIVWWARFIPITPQRMRYSLSQISVFTPHAIREEKGCMERIEEEQIDVLLSIQNKDNKNNNKKHPQLNHCTVRGVLLTNPNYKPNSSSSSSNKEKKNSSREMTSVLFWIYGGAYLGGDADGNAPVADYVGNYLMNDEKSTLYSHVFVPDFRLAPFGTMDDVLWDIVLAYRWLCQQIMTTTNDDDDDDTSSNKNINITLLGISSGGALAVRLMQLIAEYERGETLLPSYLSTLIAASGVRMPRGAALVGPYVDYTKEAEHHPTFVHNARLDLIVTETVQENGLPYLEQFIPKNSSSSSSSRKDYSPVHRSMEGLPPMLVLLSEQEAVYDMAMELVNRARRQKVEVTVGVWKYMCHVFTILYGFIPEGQHSMQVLREWMIDLQQ